MSNNTSKENLIAWYPFQGTADIGRDLSGNGNNAIPKGKKLPEIKIIGGRKAAQFYGGEFGSSYLELPADFLKEVNDHTGFTVSTWVYCDRAVNVWERIFDFGKGSAGPYMFLTRFLRGVCFQSGDLAADADKACPVGEWVHVAMTVTGTNGGALSNAGPRIYLNGELTGDGFISQTSSGTYKKLREWFATFDTPSNYSNNFIGHSQFNADADFCGSLSDFRIYKAALSEEEVIGLMCESLSEENIVTLARDKFLPKPNKIITGDIYLPLTLMEGKVTVEWTCDRPEVITSTGKVTPKEQPVGITLLAKISCGNTALQKEFHATVVPSSIAPYEFTIHGDKKVLDISRTLYGLFYEDINNAADGGIYAEMIQNRSFEDFTYKIYDSRSGENGKSEGRNHNPLRFWFGDLEKVTPENEGGLNEHFHLTDSDANAYYITVPDGTRLYNRGFCDNNLDFSMKFTAGGEYEFTIWAKADNGAAIDITLLDGEENTVSNTAVITVEGNGIWKKYSADVLTAAKDVMGQICLSFTGDVLIDMVSLMPKNVWGSKEEASSPSAHKNYTGNSNYRLRKDLVEALADLHPSFLRFPGGCISEGSFIWDNVYDWKDSIGDVATRKENFNVWGYMMTMGLGYMEYFQLAEDLNAEPLPVMACGVLCQARSDYANPAGGKLQEKYIANFTDLIDFAINTDFENNKWAAIRKEMGHEEPFGLHYLGVGNENWGTEFFASFEEFKYAIDKHMEKNYPGYDLTILSTAGAQADDDAYQQGWKFLAGYLKGGATVAFTDGETSFEKAVTWYPHEKNYMNTIVDEHYYRANDYLLENADRYNYYYRPYENGKLVENQVSKVFVGEYASSDKNTLAGAVAEAAVMTGFEKNSDVVRLAAYAPLFNKVVTDGTYRWTPDCIWFDNESVWRTPNYYVQQMFAEYVGDTLLETSYETYHNGEKISLTPHGGVMVTIAEGEAILKTMTVTDNQTGNVLFAQNFAETLDKKLLPFRMEETESSVSGLGLIIRTTTAGQHGFYINEPKWHDYTITVSIEKLSDTTEIFVGTGLTGVTDTNYNPNKLSMHQYCIGCGNNGTGLKVVKDGKEGYTMGDYSSSVYAGNLRACYDEAVPAGEYTVTVNFGKKDGKGISCYYENASEKFAPLDCKLESYNRDVFHSVTEDQNKVYAKLVNADNFEKKIKLNFSNLSPKQEATLITLTGDNEWVHTPNVNTKEWERIVPVKNTLFIESTGCELILPANSVSVVVLDK